MGNTTMTIHGLTTKFLPLYFMIIAFFFVSDYTRDSLSGIDPTDFFLGSILLFGALIFLYEGINNYPRRGTHVGSAGFVFFFLFFIANAVFSVAIFYDMYQPLEDESDVNLILQIVIGVNSIMLLSTGLYEIHKNKRYVAEHAGFLGL